MEENKSENEELRKQIQYLTEVIETAKSRGQHSEQKQPRSYHRLPAKYTHHGNVSRSFKPSFHKGASYPGYADWNTRTRKTTNTYTADTSQYLDPPRSNFGSRQPALQYNTKYSKAKPQLLTREGENDKPAATECSSLNKQSCLPKQSINSKEMCEKTKFKQSVSSELTHHSSKAAAISVTNPSRKSTVTDTNSSEKPVSLENIKQTKLKSKPTVLNTSEGQMKSSLNSGNLTKMHKESNSYLLKDKIEKMRSKIIELKKTLSERQSMSDLHHQEKHTHGPAKCSSEIEKSESKICDSPPKRTALENKRSDLSSLEKNVTHKTDSSITKFGSPVKQQIYSPQKSESPSKYVYSKGASLQTEQNRPSEKLYVQSVNVPEVRAAVSTMNPDLKQPQSDLVSLSKYKLTRVSSSPTKHSPGKAGESLMDSISTSLNEVGKLSFNTEQLNSSVKNRSANLVPGATKRRLSTSTPAKFIKKSKYSITRLRTSGKKGSSKKKLVRSQSYTPAKFISFSKYAIKRVRRSLSDENKQGLQKNASLYKASERCKKGQPCSDSVQSSVRVVRSKFKMEKVHSDTSEKSHFLSSRGSESYKFQRRNLYNHGRYQSFRQRYQDRSYWSTGYGFSSYLSMRRGRYRGRYKGRGMGKHFQHETYNRRLAVSQKYLQRRLQRLKETFPFNPRHRLDRRTVVSDLKKPVNFIMINGMLYKSNAKSLMKASTQKTCVTRTSTEVHGPKKKKLDATNMKTVTVRGVKFKVDSHGRSLKRVHQPGPKQGKPDATSSSKASQISRIDIGGVTYMQTKPGTLERVGSVKSRLAATRVVNKTVQRAAAKYKKDNTKIMKKKKYCMFYNRFGKCNRKGSCTYIHDPDKVAVCTRFLRGTCKVKDCPFSHKVSKDKMPVCSYYLKGVCNRDDCPYLHVNVNRDAEICQEFVKGYCPLGEKCKKKHILKCPEFTKTGSCSKGEKCNLQHRRRKRKSQLSEQSTSENSKKPKLFEQPISPASVIVPVEARLSASSSVTGNTQLDKNTVNYENDPEVPFKERKLPAYISLKTNTNKIKEDTVVVLEDTPYLTVKPVMKIRPQL
ncbi:uncharacterized protein LOC123549705 [Mercenaria mercenaria]|uniref:uncharacterized protein LOC123549705 n=1 Tax=Mercenaria mercenaria TaxID=6596 RepID=UPI00234EFD80|nr:uncharacterized protein LOC123549705 [Mercenaria mercenaria]